ncbi:MAG TPA: hypothetical protein PKI16_02895 [Candidatus Dojkabacteria bacterium]|nr:hypothetical protein [Candidatus Dojkabacteria bacterium]
MQKKLAILSFLILLFLLVLTGVWALFIRKDDTSNDWKTLTEDNITLTYQYAGVNVWKYNVKGQLPNPCHSAQVDALVAESYPEQVTVKVNIEENKSTDTVCAQVIQELNISGEFNASEKATVTLQVNKQ